MAPVDDREPDSPVPSGAASDPAVVDAAGEEGSAERHGRIGYGRYGRFTPLALAAFLIAGVVLIGLYQDRGDSASSRPPGAGHLLGRPAPDVSLTLLDGTTWRLGDRRGSVVLVNFWASWCAPCREEMPLLQDVHEAARSGEPVAVVGVGIRTDHDADARALVRELGLTYPIGRDTATEAPGLGPVEHAFGLPASYPSTVVIRPDGVVDAVHVGPLDAEGIRALIEDAR